MGTKNFDCFANETHDKIDGQEDGVKPAFLMQELCHQRVQYGKYALIHIFKCSGSVCQMMKHDAKTKEKRFVPDLLGYHMMEAGNWDRVHLTMLQR